MNFDILRQKILEKAIRGELVPQLESEPEVAQIDEAPENVPFAIPEKWKWVSLGAISNRIHYGYNASAKERGNAKLLRITDIQNGSVNWTSVPYCSLEDREIAKFRLAPGDIVIARTGGTIGKSFLIAEKLEELAVFASYLIRVIPDKLNVNPSYLLRFLDSPYYWEQLSDNSRGTGQPNVNAKALAGIKVPLPPIEEQLRIVAKISQLFDQIELAEKAYNELSEPLAERFRQLCLEKAIQGKLVPQLESEPGVEQIGEAPENVPFAIPEKWKWCQIKNLTTICSARRVHKSDWQMEGVPFFRAREIAKLAEQGFVNNELFISEELYAQLTKGGLVEEGDLMITAVGTLGKVYIVKRGDRFYYKDASVICMKRCQHIDPHFAKIIFTSPFMKNQIIDASSGTTVGTITIKGAMDYWVPIPPIEEQHRIVAKLNELLGIVVQLENTISAP